jgi:hypothetical protein
MEDESDPSEPASVPAASVEKKKPRRSRGRKKTGASAKKQQAASRGATARPFPASTFEEALTLADGIQKFASGQRIRRLTLFDKLGKPPESGPSRQLITNSNRYGLSAGSYKADSIDLTADGRIASSNESDPVQRLQTRFRLAIEQIPAFKTLYDRYKNSKLPTQAVLRDALIEAGVPEEHASEAVDTFILNAKFIGLLREVSGAERLLPIEHLVEELQSSSGIQPSALPVPTVPQPERGDTPWDSVCFYISPIGDADSDPRRHADLFFSSIVEPALAEFKLTVVRADQIGEPGMITRQIIEHIVHARLVIADLSFHNPNVFYELSLRHACRKPTVQMVRLGDRIPFDIDQVRTIRIDTTSIYTLVPKLDTYRAELATQVRRALADPDAVDNPITVFMPGLRATLKTSGGGA